MLRSTRHVAAVAAVLTTLGTTALAAQSGDSTRATRRDSATAGERQLRRGMAPRWQQRVAPGGMGRDRARPALAQRGRRGNALLAGITLSTEQERALRTTRARRVAELKPLLIEGVSARSDVQIAQLNGDQRALDAANARLRANREKLVALRDSQSYVRDLRAVLTPDQQQKLDTNLESLGTRRMAVRRGARMRDRGAQPRMTPRFRETFPTPRTPRLQRDEELFGNTEELLPARDLAVAPERPVR